MRTDTGTPERTVHGSNVIAGLCAMRQSSGMLSFMFSMQCFELIVCTQQEANQRLRKARKILNFNFATI